MNKVVICMNDIPRFNPYLLTLLSRYNCFCGGGAARSIIDSSVINDYDLFFKTRNDVLNFCSELEKQGTKKKFHCVNDSFISYEIMGLKIQLIYHRFFQSADEVLDSFDFTVTQFVLDGEKLIHTTSVSLSDLTNKRLNLYKLTYPAATIKRIHKYINYGFSPNHNMFSRITNLIAEKHSDIVDNELVYVD